MKYDPDIHHRKSVRLKEFDYFSDGAYFVTICLHGRQCLFGEVVDGDVKLTEAGRMVEVTWQALGERFPHIQMDHHVVMPNHFHGILFIGRGEPCVRPPLRNGGDIPARKEQDDHNQGDHKDRPYGTVEGSFGRMMQAFKSLTTNAYIRGVHNFGWSTFDRRLWQRNYYERVIRNDEELQAIRRYIEENPGKWDMDEENPERVPT